jgi:prophage regulatory protein
MSASDKPNRERERKPNKRVEPYQSRKRRRDLEQDREQSPEQQAEAQQHAEQSADEAVRKRERWRRRVTASRQSALAAVKAAGLQRILRLPEVEAATGKKRSAIYDGMADGTFPRPVPLGERAVGWIESEILAWQEARIAERDKRAERIAERHQATIKKRESPRLAGAGF